MVPTEVALNSVISGTRAVEGKVSIPDKTTSADSVVSDKRSQINEAVAKNILENRVAFEKGIEEVNRNLKPFNIKLSFMIDEPTGRTVIRVSNSETDEIIREIPPMEMLKIIARLSKILGFVVDEKA